MHPSLYALFCRSKYAKGIHAHDAEDEQSVQRRHLQTERFAVAAIAFCLKHDEEFLRHFLAQICDTSTATQNFEIFIEDKSWGDLVLVAADGSLVLVVECKIRADLEEHQDPTCESGMFWSEGYGQQIIGEYASQRSLIKYIVLGYPHELSGLPSIQSNITCLQKYWADLKAGLPKTKLCQDLDLTLAALNVTAFRSGKSNRMKKSIDAKSAAETFGLLKDVLEEADFVGAFGKLEVSFQNDEDWFYGLGVNTNDSVKGRFKLLHEVVKPENNQIAWYGYTKGAKPDESQPSVWFYCASEQESVLKTRLGKAGIDNSAITTAKEDGWNYLIVSATVEDIDSANGDKEWFKSIFAAVLQS